MLVNNFYNFTETKRPPTIAPLCQHYGGTLIDFTDSQGCELKIVLPLKALQGLFLKLCDYEPIQGALDQAIINLGARHGYELKVKAKKAGETRGRR